METMYIKSNPRNHNKIINDFAKINTLQKAHALFQEYPYLGHFMSYELVCDLRYTLFLDKGVIAPQSFENVIESLDSLSICVWCMFAFQFTRFNNFRLYASVITSSSTVVNCSSKVK